MSYFESQYDESGFELPLPTAACEATGQYPDLACEGDVFTRYSRSGMTSSRKCESHWQHHNDVLDGISRRYPDSSVAPAWFDPTYAGERWSDDY